MTAQPATLTPDQIAAAAAARVAGKHGDLPFVSFAKQAEALDDEMEYIIGRLTWRIDNGKVAPSWGAARRKHLQQCLATIHALRDAEAVAASQSPEAPAKSRHE